MKKRYSDSLLWLLITAAAAILCAVVRRFQLLTAFEGEFRFLIPGAPATVVLLVLFAVSAVLLAALAHRQPVSPVLKDNSALSLWAENNTLFLVGVFLAGFLCLIAAPVLFIRGQQMREIYQAGLLSASLRGDTAIPGGNNGVLTLAAAVTSALSFIALLVVGRSAQKGSEKGRLALLIPVINNCLWLMEFYRSHAANPVRWDYGPLLVAIVAGTLFYLGWAGLYAGAFAPRRTLWIAGMTVVLSLTALMGDWSLGSALLLTSQMAAALAVLWCVPHNLRYPPELPAEENPAEEKLEEETHE